MRKQSSILWIVSIIFLGAGITAAWTLRSPLGRLANVAWGQVHPGPSVTFAVVGDNHGDNPIYRQILTSIKGQPISFLLNLADTSEYGTKAEFDDVAGLEQALPFPVYHTVGNHDIKTDSTRQVFTDAFHQPAWQSIDQGPVHLIILDNADRHVGFPSASLDWFEQDLAAHQDKTLVVAYHRPFDLPFAKLVGDDETTLSRKSNARMVALIKKYDVKYVFTAHLHTFFRYRIGEIPAVVSGGGGDPAQDVLGGPSADYFHYLIVTVRNGQVDVKLNRVELKN